MKWIFSLLITVLSFYLLVAQSPKAPSQDFYDLLSASLVAVGDEVGFPALFSPDDLQISRNASLVRTLGKYLRDHPEMRVRIVSHTNCRTNKAYNLALSRNRAHLIKKLLIDSDIDPSRLEAVGVGDKFPLEACTCNDCTDAQHQRNERIAVTLIGIMKPTLAEEPTAVPDENLVDPKKSIVLTLRACIDSNGNVTEVEYLPYLSSRADEELVKKAIEDAKSWKFGPSLSEEPCSNIIYTLPPQG